jgi:phosphoadenosine phosphosulfate reductase
METMKDKINELNEQLHGKSAIVVLKFFIDQFGDKVTLGSSMGAEDQVLTDMMVKISKDVDIFTLDTGRLFPETYTTIDKTNKKYGITIKVFFPVKDKVQNMVNEHGINLFYDSIENRKLCCNIRKIEPLRRALYNSKIWVTGLRKDQSVTRFYTKLVEWDEDLGLIKINPLLNWTEKDVWKYIHDNDIPYNELHDKGFPSIGCQPCTRAIQSGEDIRAGRWWWEAPDQKECGLHVSDKK